MNQSPWLAQLNPYRPQQVLSRDCTADVVIVGGGIAGICTAYFTLRDTSKSVLLLEGGRLAHGATGHNAGQITSYFERPFPSLVEEFGLELAAKGQAAVVSAWELLAQIAVEAQLRTQPVSFTGYAGFVSADQVKTVLESLSLQAKAGLHIEYLYLAENCGFAHDLPEHYRGLYELVAQERVLQLLETHDNQYVAALSSRKGVMNSALFCEEIVEYLLSAYANRFTVYEHSPVQKVLLEAQKATLRSGEFSVTAERVVLCTNGFSNIMIVNDAGGDVDYKFHQLVHGTVGCMAGYFEQSEKLPVAISYCTKESADAPYYYVTRRVFGGSRLVCVGGPEHHLYDKEHYDPTTEYIPSAREHITAFLKATYIPDPRAKPHYAFHWQGLMGYTKNGVRCVGPEPCNPVLLYNLGCNGVGILPSIYGGKRIAQFLLHGTLEKSIFDPQDTRCIIRPI